MIQNLTAENARKLERVSELEGELAATAERNKHETVMCQDEHDAALADLEHQRTVLATRLGHQSAAVAEMARSNTDMQHELDKLLRRGEGEGARHAALVHDMKQQLMAMQDGLERTFRKALIEQKQTTRQTAQQVLDSSAQEVLQANARLRDELAMQAAGITALLDQCKAQGSEAQSLRRAQAWLRRASAQQVEELSDLHRRRLAGDARTAQIEQQMDAAVAQRQRLQQQLDRARHPPEARGRTAQGLQQLLDQYRPQVRTLAESEGSGHC
ncbi:hypothetical protein JKP88DRAFT_283485 [Tribonema minus]|uniref:Uncharacterized protein n=1 Tax=Tribonema minus TaxID=303371 RepID=A0A835YL02_9STRA|nr:hypothetical protein JKP88DRAFT_283485 [Tribonema minus]